MSEKRLIDANEAKSALIGWETDPTDEEIEYTIDNLQTVDAVEVVHGRWKFNRGAAPNEKLYFCSVCTDGESDYGTDNYCPNCGAKMDGGNEDGG